MKDKFLLTIKAEDAPGLLSRVLIMLSRRRIGMESVTMSRTDIHSVVMITGEILIDATAISNLRVQLEKIIEVISSDIVPVVSVTAHKLAFFKLSVAMLNESHIAAIQKYGAQIVKVSGEDFIISKAGSEQVIKELYNRLEGEHLIGFAQTGIVADTALLESNDEWRISKLAA